MVDKIAMGRPIINYLLSADIPLYENKEKSPNSWMGIPIIEDNYIAKNEVKFFDKEDNLLGKVVVNIGD